MILPPPPNPMPSTTIISFRITSSSRALVPSLSPKMAIRGHNLQAYPSIGLTVLEIIKELLIYLKSFKLGILPCNCPMDIVGWEGPTIMFKDLLLDF